VRIGDDRLVFQLTYILMAKGKKLSTGIKLPKLKWRERAAGRLKK
jgi:hypothetical protein